MSKEYYAEVRCDYLDDQNYWCVDAWETSDGDEDGRVIAVIHNPDGDVYYKEVEAMISPMAQEVIKAKIDELRSDKQGE